MREGYFAELDSYNDRREFEEWLDQMEQEADMEESWPDDMVGEEEFA